MLHEVFRQKENVPPNEKQHQLVAAITRRNELGQALRDSVQPVTHTIFVRKAPHTGRPDNRNSEL